MGIGSNRLFKIIRAKLGVLAAARFKNTVGKKDYFVFLFCCHRFILILLVALQAQRHFFGNTCFYYLT